MDRVEILEADELYLGVVNLRSDRQMLSERRIGGVNENLRSSEGNRSRVKLQCNI